jgi:putative membrane-bound dehydrogenase-like protein
MSRVLAAIAVLLSCARLFAIDANRLTYLDSTDPFYPDRNFAKLTTPQWVGESNVEAVVVLAIDDMRETKDYENFLRPILNRLKQIDGHAPVSIMTCTVNPKDPQLQSWLKEGLSLEVHTIAHPCPLLANTNYAAAEQTVYNCIDLLNKVPGNKPIAFRMPCCDSMNSSSPRFYAEIFNRATPTGKFLAVDSSVMNITTTNDTTLPRELTTDSDGKERFRKYVPFENFGITIEDYPYPYVIGSLCWEFPAAVPSDWEAQNLHGSKNAKTLEDWKRLLDATVIKQGVFNFIFHPHGWIDNAQIVEFIDYADKKYGRKVKFLNFREALQRLNKNLLAGKQLRGPTGRRTGVKLLDVNNDGFMDVVLADEQSRVTRIWNNAERKWIQIPFPAPLVVKDEFKNNRDTSIRWGVMQSNGYASMIVRSEIMAGAWDFDGKNWVTNGAYFNGLTISNEPVYTRLGGMGLGVRLRDFDHSGRCSLIVGNHKQNAVFSWSPEKNSWVRRNFDLPAGARVTDAGGLDIGLRFVDLNGDGYDDIVFSNEKQFAIYSFLPQRDPLGFEEGWTREVVPLTQRGNATNSTVKIPKKKRKPPVFLANELPPIMRDGQNNGVWFKYGSMWIQNESTPTEPIANTANLHQVVNRLTYDELIKFGQPKPKSPQDSLACITVLPRFKVELVASEPLVKSPVAFEWGADGKLWVVEMGDYPLGLDGKGKPGGTVRFLEDTNHDGIYDKSTVFLEGLNFPNGIYPWRKGVIISAAPEIFYAEDTDGDGKADVHKTLFTGFVEGNQQHRANGFDYGLDGWLYGANGDSGGDVQAVGALLRKPSKFKPGAPVSINGLDFRFNPDTGQFEAQAGETQFGRHRDDWGNWFGNNNATMLWHFFLPIEYLSRNPNLSVSHVNQLLAQYPDGTRLYPTSKTLQRFNDPNGANHLTSGNSPTPYRDELFGHEFPRTVFISEPVHNLIHREILEPNGVTFKSHRATNDQHREFLTSSDNWFRPTQMKTGPDGALYFADMYRLVIEHPEWIPAEIQKQYDLRAGADKGRIYRVYPAKAKLQQIPDFTKRNNAQLCDFLESANGWRRDTAQRLLIQRANPAAVPILQAQFINSQQAEFWKPFERPYRKSPVKGRIHILYTLKGLHALNAEILTSALKDLHAEVREHAAHLCEPFLSNPDNHELQSTALNLVNDPEIRVRYQLAFSLGSWNDPRAGEALAKIALRDSTNEAVQIAVMCSATNHVGEMLATVFSSSRPPGNIVEQLIGLATAMNDNKAFETALAKIAPASGKIEPWQMTALSGFLDALDRRSTSLKKFHDAAPSELKAVIEQLEPLFVQARASATNSSASNRVAAVRLLGRGLSNQDEDVKELGSLLTALSAPELEKAALNNLRKTRSPIAGEVMLAGWKTYLPDTRTEIMNAILSRLEWTKPLLDGLENGSIPSGQIAAPFQQKLLTHVQPSVSARAKKIFGSASSDRKKLVHDYQSVASLKGDAKKGTVLFKQNCATCHFFKGQGNAVGPDLGALGNKTAQTLLVAILDPNQAIESRYIAYNATLKNDRELSGVISAETPTSITIKTAGGSEETILRTDLASLTSSGLSLMPEGLEKVLDLQAMADLIAYINGK